MPRLSAFWTAPRLSLVLTAAAILAPYHWLYRQGWCSWLLDLPFAILALVLLLFRSRPECFYGAVVALGARHPGILCLVLGYALTLGLNNHRPPRPDPGFRPIPALLTFLFLSFFVAKPAYYMVLPEKRDALLRALAPSFPRPGPTHPDLGHRRAHELLVEGRVLRRGGRVEARAEAGRGVSLVRSRGRGAPVPQPRPEFLHEREGPHARRG